MPLGGLVDSTGHVPAINGGNVISSVSFWQGVVSCGLEIELWPLLSSCVLFTSLRDGNRPHRIVGQPLVTANDVGH